MKPHMPLESEQNIMQSKIMLQLESKKLKAHRSLHKTFKNCKLTNIWMFHWCLMCNYCFQLETALRHSGVDISKAG